MSRGVRFLHSIATGMGIVDLDTPGVIEQLEARHPKRKRGGAVVSSAGLRWRNKENIWFWHAPAASTASGTTGLGHYYSNPSLPTPECIAGLGGGLEMEYFGYYPHFGVLTGEVRHGLDVRPCSYTVMWMLMQPPNCSMPSPGDLWAAYCPGGITP
jgi:hypothetical protein